MPFDYELHQLKPGDRAPDLETLLAKRDDNGWECIGTVTLRAATHLVFKRAVSDDAKRPNDEGSDA